MAEIGQGVKVLLQSFAPDIITYALPQAHDIAPLPAELATGPQLLPDAVFQGICNDKSCIFQLEAQLLADATMPRRCFEYGARLSTAYGLPVISIVLWLEAKTVPVSPYVMRIGELELATWSFINLQMAQLNAQDMLATRNFGMLPLIPFMQGSDLALIEETARTIQQQSPTEHQEDLEGVLALFASRYFGPQPLLDMLRRLFMSSDLLEHFPLYHVLTEMASEKGMAQGVAQGVAQGRLDGLRQSAHLILENRFGHLLADVDAALQTADELVLLEVIAHAVTDTDDQVRERLHLAHE